MVSIVLLASASSSLAGLHAQCSLEWVFGISCQNVSTALVSQIKKWNGEEGCASGGEKCLYDLVSHSEDKPGSYVIKATHKTPKRHFVDDLTFTLTSQGQGSPIQCAVEGFSTSEVFYAFLDFGTNYCNMRNLAEGSGLTKARLFGEKVDPDKCTQVKSANCEKY